MYVSNGTGTAASPAVSLDHWTLDMTVDRVEVSSFGDSNKQYVQGFADRKGTYTGYWDPDVTAAYVNTDTIFAAVESSTGGNLYLYPSTDASSKYFYGAGWIEASIDTNAKDAIKVSGSFAAAGAWGRL